MAYRKYKAVYTVHYGHYRFEAGEEFTSKDLKPGKGADPALEPLPEVELQKWLEGGQVKRDVHVAEKPQETYTITCAGDPGMKSIALELAR